MLQIGGLLQQGVDGGLAVGKEGQQRAEHDPRFEARPPSGLDHLKPLLDARRPRLP